MRGEGDLPTAVATTSFDPRDPGQALSHLASITGHREADALAVSILRSLLEMLDVSAASLLLHGVSESDAGTVIRVRRPSEAPSTFIAELSSGDETCAGFGSTVQVPIPQRGSAQGLLMVEGGRDPANLRPVLEGFALVYANMQELLDAGSRDRLTGLLNRRAFDNSLDRWFATPASGRCDAPGGDGRRLAKGASRWLAMVDIDRFKLINDSFGHLFGDEVILLVAQRMRASFRRNDALFRFGGEEFVVLLRADNEAQAREALERFRRNMAELSIQQVGQVTISMGFARIGENDHPANVLDRADRALYFAKNHGRNRVVGESEMEAAGVVATPTAVGTVDLF